MSVITHLANTQTLKAVCNDSLQSDLVWSLFHIILDEKDFINDDVTRDTRCAECVDILDARNKKRQAKIDLNTIYGKPSSIKLEVVHKADLVAAFNIVAERDKEITELCQDILNLERKQKRTEDSLDGAVDAGSAMINKINELTEENVRLENELRYAKAENAPLARQNQRLAKNRDILVDALNAVDNIVKDSREKLKGE